MKLMLTDLKRILEKGQRFSIFTTRLKDVGDFDTQISSNRRSFTRTASSVAVLLTGLKFAVPFQLYRRHSRLSCYCGE
ncbi:hypothetical protein [Paenibacillus tyrfis]|uniref:hypothetical protein n=1 Tax=Paenibacillus tyrfis TaxID=1501230 RepID=UPI00209F7E87|nr:hypothetical protein [Paenibacillus tyrfis]MCP1311559.1 hypothetical protein [Paenibacillus tyrfis]